MCVCACVCVCVCVRVLSTEFDSFLLLLLGPPPSVSCPFSLVFTCCPVCHLQGLSMEFDSRAQHLVNTAEVGRHQNGPSTPQSNESLARTSQVKHSLARTSQVKHSLTRTTQVEHSLARTSQVKHSLARTSQVSTVSAAPVALIRRSYDLV